MLLQVHIICYAKQWEARIAASQCIRMLAEYMQHFTPEHIAQRAGVTQDVNDQSKQAEVKMLESFDIGSVLESGKKLLQSGGEVSLPWTQTRPSTNTTFSSTAA